MSRHNGLDSSIVGVRRGLSFTSISRSLLGAIGARVTGPIPPELGDLSFLTELALHNNKIGGESTYLRLGAACVYDGACSLVMRACLIPVQPR